VRLIKNLNVSAGLVNSAVGKVVRVLYNNADCGDLLASRLCISFKFADAYYTSFFLFG